jgi:hypothetical protein
MREAAAPSTGGGCSRPPVHAPLGVVIVTPPKVPRKAEGTKGEGRVVWVVGVRTNAARDSIKAGARKLRLRA